MAGTEDEGERGQLGDPAILRAFAHPTRNRVLGELSARGHARAADLAAALHLPANQLSFHLRELARYGLIEEAPELARDGRDRVWKPRYPRGFNIEVPQLRESPGGEAAVAVWTRQSAARTRAAVDRAYDLEAREGSDHVMISDVALRLSQAEARELSEELSSLNNRWRDRGRSAQGAEDRETYHLLVIVQPMGEDPE